MAYTLYKNVQVLNVKREEVVRQTRSVEIADPSRRRSNYFVSVAEFSNVPYHTTISDFKADIFPG